MRRPLAKLPADFYSSDYFTTRLIDFLGERPKQADQPFFAYLAFTAPHWPLQAHPEDIARYKGRYDEGFDVLRERRLARQRELGLRLRWVECLGAGVFVAMAAILFRSAPEAWTGLAT